jgi:phosphorylcholine metabolism protein LicD
MILLRKIKNRVLKYVSIYNSESAIQKRLYLDYDKIDKEGIGKNGLKISLLKVNKVLNDLEINYSVGRGTLLGIYRDHAFIKGDNDIDIDIFDDRYLYDIASIMPFDLVMTTIINGKYQQLVMRDNETGVLIDFWFYENRGSEYVYRNEHGYFSLPERKVKNVGKIVFENNSLHSFDPEWYCRYWYGENWKNPLKYTSSWVDHYETVCTAFTRKSNFNITIVNKIE